MKTLVVARDQKQYEEFLERGEVENPRRVRGLDDALGYDWDQVEIRILDERHPVLGNHFF